MTPTEKIAAGCVLTLLALGLSACTLVGSGPRPAPRLYTLSSLAFSDAAGEPAASLPHLVIGIGPVRLPEYLDRRDIIVRNSRNEIELIGLSQWAEPMAEALARAVADNLSALLQTHRIVQFPWRPAVPVVHQVAFQVIQFDGRPGEEVVLRAGWQLFTGDGLALLDFGQAVVREPVADASVDALVAAHSRAVEGFSRSLAASIAKLAR
jgi:uncharacterized protein